MNTSENIKVTNTSSTSQPLAKWEPLDIENEFASIVQQLTEKKNQKNDSQNVVVSEYKHLFEEFNSLVVNPVVESSNAILAPSGSQFDTINNEQENGSFFSTCVVFHDTGDRINLLSDPYIIIEGYPQTKEIRIAEAMSSDKGSVVSISDLSRTAIQEYQKIIGSKLIAVAKQVANQEFA